MKRIFLQSTAAITAIAFITSCTNIKDDRQRTITEGGLAGSVIGGLAGGIIGHQSGRGFEGALAGAALGGLAGVAYGNHVANKKAAYASQEAWLRACIEQADRANAQARAYNRSLQSKIAGLESRYASAKASGNRSEMRNIKQAVVSLQKESNQQVKAVDTEISQQSTVVRQTGDAGLSSRVTQLRSTRSSLNSSQQRLADLNNQIDV